MTSPTALENRRKALEQRKALADRMLARRPKGSSNSAVVAPIEPAAGPRAPTPCPERYGKAGVSVYRDDESVASAPTQAVISLVNLYLDAAKSRTKHIALLWPAAPHALAMVHVLATLERWAVGNKQGVRGLLFPAKTNVFHPLNHLHLDREKILEWAELLLESRDKPNPHVEKAFWAKDAFLYSLASLKSEAGETFNPTMSELIPRFVAGAGFQQWSSCAANLLEHIAARLARRHKKALGNNREELGAPKTAPDALFALDTRMSKDERLIALRALKNLGQPEVVLVNATRQVRLETRSLPKLVGKVCADIDLVFSPTPPGVVVVTDDPSAAFQLRKELTGQEGHPHNGKHHAVSRDYWITGICSGTKNDGLLPPGISTWTPPAPREFDVEVVDTEAARVISRLYRIANRLPNARTAGNAVTAAAGYLSRMASWPCGIRTVVEWLRDSAASDYMRRIYSWSTFHAALAAFSQTEEAAGERQAIETCLEDGTRMHEAYQPATPFALRLASFVEYASTCSRHRMYLVFTSPINRRFAERFLSQHEFTSGAKFAEFADRVVLTTSAQLDESLDQLDGARLVFVGLDDEGLRLALTDNRIPKHAAVLLTQRAGQHLRTVFHLIEDKFSEFNILKPRMDSFLRQLSQLPEDQTIFVDTFSMPAFRTELSTDLAESANKNDPEAWSIRLEGGLTLYRRPTHLVYVYDPASSNSTERGFRPCNVSSLGPGDRLFVMSPELRELVESALKDAGVHIEHDKSFESALHDYHQAIAACLQRTFPAKTTSERARRIRAAILADNPNWVSDFPEEEAVRYWIDVEDLGSKPFKERKPQAPMKEAHFAAFARALGIHGLQAAFYWQSVIMAIRNARRIDGRHVSDIYSYMLLQPESAMLHSKISRQTLKVLFQQARENTMVVENTAAPQGGKPNG